MKRVILLILVFNGLSSAQQGEPFEMSSPRYAVRTSAFCNAGGHVSGQSFAVQQQFGTSHIGRMESATFTVGTLVDNFTDTNEALPGEFALLQNYPNPFNQSTTIRFHLPAESELRLAVYSLLGREITILFDGLHAPGEFELKYSGQNAFGAPLPSGVYFCRMHTKWFDKTIKFAILR